ncbi:MAG: Crp/Fnr family transcriptional regulator [Henriciella sp.]
MLEYEATDQHLMIILSGKTTLVYLQDGKPAPTAIFREAGEVLHHAGMHLQIPNPFRIDAVDDGTRVVMLDRDAVYDLISSDVTFAEFLFRDLSERFMTALGYLREQRSAPLIIRLAKRILTITRHRPSVEFTQTELADILAVTRISISKAIKTLEEQGLIQRAERGVLSVNRDKLEAWVEAEVQATGE